MNQQSARAAIEKFNLPLQVVAEIAGVWKQDVSSFMRAAVSAKREFLICNAVAEFVSFAKTLPYPPDVRDIPRLRDAIAYHRLEMIEKFGSHAADDWLVQQNQNGEEAARAALDETGALAALGSEK